MTACRFTPKGIQHHLEFLEEKLDLRGDYQDMPQEDLDSWHAMVDYPNSYYDDFKLLDFYTFDKG